VDGGETLLDLRDAAVAMHVAEAADVHEDVETQGGAGVEGAEGFVVAAPVASEPGVAKLSPLAERVIALRRVPEVGPLERHYGEWRQVSHDEALACLEKARE